MPQANNMYGFWPVDLEYAKIQRFPEAASQTFARGDAVILSSGKVAIATAASAEILGVAAAPSSGTTDNPTPVWTAWKTQFFGVASGANAILAGATCDIEGATGAMMLNENATATNVATIVNEADTDEVTTSARKRYRFEFLLNTHADTA